MSFCSNIENGNLQEDKKEDENPNSKTSDSNNCEPWNPIIKELEKSARKSPEIDQFETHIDSWNKVTFGDNINGMDMMGIFDFSKHFVLTINVLKIYQTTQKYCIYIFARFFIG